ncbi:MAG: hypothetical protein FD124_1799, partial [Alphaproteobacteria bacterium]
MNERPRGLGRGLSALLGETAFGHSQPRAPEPPPQAAQPAAPAPATPAPSY